MDRYQETVIRIGAKLRAHRRTRQLTLEEVSKEIGVSAATLSRLERRSDGEISAHGGRLPDKPDIRTLERISNWLPGDPDDFGFSFSSQRPLHLVEKATPEIIEAHLRADRNLDPKSADLLAQLVRSVYLSLAREPEPTERIEKRRGDEGSEK